MSKNRKSIGERLATAKSIEVRQEIVHDWAAAWEREQSDLIHDLEQAIKHGCDYDRLCVATGQLKAVTLKKFSAIPNIVIKLEG